MRTLELNDANMVDLCNGFDEKVIITYNNVVVPVEVYAALWLSDWDCILNNKESLELAKAFIKKDMKQMGIEYSFHCAMQAIK